MPGFYGWMSDSDRQAIAFSDSQAEANKSTTSSKISGKSGEHVHVFVMCTIWKLFYSPLAVISLNQRFSNCAACLPKEQCNHKSNPVLVVCTSIDALQIETANSSFGIL